MRRLVPLLLLAFVPVSPAFADGCPPATCALTASAPPGSRLILQRLGGAHAGVVAYDAASGARRFSLPPGTLSPDGRAFFAAAPGGHRTYIRRFDPATGARGRLWSIRGRWALVGVSLRGRRLVLQRAPVRRGGFTPFAVVDARTHAVRRFKLRDVYELDALSPSGRGLFLVHRPWASAKYDLRTYDVETGRLRATRLAEPDEKMQGIPWNAVSTRDGRWLLTLYLGVRGGAAFVHALDLVHGVAHCVDLPDGTARTAPAYANAALVLAPDERRLYVVDPVLGRANVVDLQRLRVARSIAFRAVLPPSSAAGPSGAVSRDGRMVYVAAGSKAFSLDTAYGIVRGPLTVARGTAPPAVVGLGFAGRRVTALLDGGGVAKLDAADGRVLSTPPASRPRLRQLPGWRLVLQAPDVLEARSPAATITLYEYEPPATPAAWRASFRPVRGPPRIRARDFGRFEGDPPGRAHAKRTFRAGRRYYEVDVEFRGDPAPAAALRDANRVLATFRR